ncbi:MAG: HAD family phosphatase [Rubrivivax sp.]|nr:HAD family phosphatase [Rubrivivax sp.]
MSGSTSRPLPCFVFDFGRVVFRWEPEALLRQLLPQHAHDAASAAHWVAQVFQSYGGDWGDYDRGVVAPAELAQRIATRTGLAVAEARRVIDAVPDALQPLPASVAWLQRLREAGHALYFLSNMPAPVADELQSRHAFLGGFDDGVFSCRVGHNKPEPAIYEIAARRFGRPVEELVFLDDHRPNVEAARSLGWRALQFHDAAQAEAEVRAAGWL